MDDGSALKGTYFAENLLWWPTLMRRASSLIFEGDGESGGVLLFWVVCDLGWDCWALMMRELGERLDFGGGFLGLKVKGEG